jgi:peptidoglycan/xylan/chitin deacetylase (PgdA/CDA1 family)
MRERPLILTYHCVDDGPPPLSVDPHLFERHLDCIQESGATVLAVTELAAALRAGRVPDRALALTFDDGAASAVRVAAPILARRGLTATFFCIAGYLGQRAAWPTLPAGVPRFELASAAELVDLATLGFEIGSHGVTHAPLHRASRSLLEHEVRHSKKVLHDQTGLVTSAFAYPYAISPSAPARELVAETYDVACAGSNRLVDLGADLLALPRLDAHYVRSPRLLRGLLDGSTGYLNVRRTLARTRRLVQQDYAMP